MNGGMREKGAFCRFYEEQTRYAPRLIADGWDEGTETTFDLTAV